MIPRILLFSLATIAILVLVSGLSPQGSMFKTFQNIQVSVSSIAYAGEIEEIRKSVDEFLLLREIKEFPQGKELAEKLDQRLNNLELVKRNCNQEISTLELADQKNPYDKLQEICPALKSVSLSRAIELFSLI